VENPKGRGGKFILDERTYPVFPDQFEFLEQPTDTTNGPFE